jgi:hypothetical protein
MSWWSDRIGAVFKVLSRATGIGYRCLKPLRDEESHRKSLQVSQLLVQQARRTEGAIRVTREEIDTSVRERKNRPRTRHVVIE